MNTFLMPRGAQGAPAFVARRGVGFLERTAAFEPYRCGVYNPDHSFMIVRLCQNVSPVHRLHRPNCTSACASTRLTLVSRH